MTYWYGQSHVGPSDSSGRRTGSKRKTQAKDELLLTLMKLKLDIPYKDLSRRFGLSLTSVSRIVNTWVLLLEKKFRTADTWPSRARVDECMPRSFKDLYPSTRCIIDCTEIPIEKPSDPISQRATWSSYKNRNTTFKVSSS